MKVLYVEDDPEAREFVRNALERSGFAVDVAEDGCSGYALASKGSYDLLLLDVGLPDESGFDLLRRLHAVQVESAAIFLTALGDVSHRVAGLDLGADDYLPKPFAFAELLARIRAVARRRHRKPSDRLLRLQDLELDRVTRRVVRAGRVVSLTPKESSLLEYLLDNQGQAVSRSMIIQEIWGYGFGGHDNLIDVHMNRLRNKIDRGFESELIRTIRGVGYMIESPEESPT